MVYLNNAATSFPKAPGVAAAVARTLEQPPLDPARGNSPGISPVARCRMQIAEQTGARPERVIFNSGATEALNAAICGLVKPGSHVIATQTEHNAVLRPLYFLRSTAGVSFDILPCDAVGRCEPSSLKELLRPETSLVAVNHISNVTGVVQDLEGFVDIVRAHGIPLLVDVSQSAGSVPVNLCGYERTVLAFTGHKGLLGPAGTGGLVLGADVEPGPWKLGGTGTHTELETMPPALPERYEAGTHNESGIAGLSEALGYINELGLDSIAAKKKELTTQLCGLLGEIRGVRVIAERPEANPCGVVSFVVEGWSTGELGFILWESYGIAVRTGLHCAPLIHHRLGTRKEGTVRASFSPFTTGADVDALADALRTIVG